jgi:NTE family protein
MSNDNSIGLVLSGGGAKGAYQAGVWKAICELGLAERVRVISGTSVGAINGAAFAAVRDPSKICRFWRDHVGQIATPNLTNLEPDQFGAALIDVLSGKPFPFHGLLDRSILERILTQLLPKLWPADAPDVFATALECRAGVLGTLNPGCYAKQCFFLNEELDADKRIKRMLASAAIPWGFDPVEIDGRRYVDGGWEDMGGDNIPVSPILKLHRRCPDIRTIIVVRCNCAADEPEPIATRLPRNTTLVEVRPSSSLRGPLDLAGDLLSPAALFKGFPIVGTLAQGVDTLLRQIRIWSGALAFDGSCAARFIRQGYSEGMEALRELKTREPLRW